MANPSVTVTGAGSEWDNAQPLPVPSIDEMQYATQVANAPAYNQSEPSISDVLSQMYNSPANKMPTYDQVMNVIKGFGSAGESLGRGFVAGIPGMAGDINQLGQEYVQPLLPQSVQNAVQALPAAPTTQSYLNQIPRYTQPFGDATANNFMEGLGTALSPDALTAAAPAARMLGQAAGERILAGKPLIPGTNTEYLNPQIMSAVKEKGGNWAQSDLPRVDALKYPIQNVGNGTFDFVRDNANPAKVAEHLEQLKQVGYSPEQIKHVENEIALNKWVDTKIKPYVRNELATPNDPVLALHEQGISHIPDIGTQDFEPIFWIKEQRQKAGMPASGFAKTPAGKDWENRADQAIQSKSAGMHIKQGESASAYDTAKRTLMNNPWIRNVPPETPIHHISSNVDRLGFEHLTDELKNAISHNSDLPEHLRIKPEALDKMTVPHAVKHVAKINEWRAKQMANAAKEHLKDFPIVHEGGNGYNIHELKLPEVGPEYKFEKIEGNKNHYWKITDPEGNVHAATGTTEENARRQFARSSTGGNFDKLDKALKNEGEQMGHCVGGYTDSVVDGHSRIFSLRDEKGGAHATVEATPKILDYNPKYIPQDVQDQIAKYAHSETIKAGYPENTQGYWNHHTGVEIQEGTKYLKNHPVMDIKQIKGKGNGEVSDKYRNYIKNWLNKESDKINYVNDLQNVGLIDTKSTSSVLTELKDMYGTDGIHLWNAAIDANPSAGARFMSREEIRKLVEPKKPEGFKTGGRVKMAEGGEPPKLTPAQMREALFADSRKYQAEKAASEPRTLEQRMIDQGRLSPKGGVSGGGAGYVPGTTNPFNPDSPLNRKNGGKIPSIDEMRLTILRNK